MTAVEAKQGVTGGRGRGAAGGAQPCGAGGDAMPTRAGSRGPPQRPAWPGGARGAGGGSRWSGEKEGAATRQKPRLPGATRASPVMLARRDSELGGALVAGGAIAPRRLLRQHVCNPGGEGRPVRVTGRGGVAGGGRAGQDEGAREQGAQRRRGGGGSRGSLARPGRERLASLTERQPCPHGPELAGREPRVGGVGPAPDTRAPVAPLQTVCSVTRGGWLAPLPRPRG